MDRWIQFLTRRKASKNLLKLLHLSKNLTNRNQFEFEYINRNTKTKKKISFRKIDIFIGGLSENLQTSKSLSASRMYYQDSLTWCVQTKKPIPKWQNIFEVCKDWRVFMVMFIASLVVAAFYYLTQPFENMHPKWDWNRFVTG